MNKAEILVLRPRFVDRDGMSYFDGYDQLDGPTLDQAGRQYEVTGVAIVAEKEAQICGAMDALERVNRVTTVTEAWVIARAALLRLKKKEKHDG